VLFLASVPSIGYAVYDVQPTNVVSGVSEAELRVSSAGLENARYRVQLDQNGDVSSVFDKQLNRELLSAPLRLAVITDNPRNWPAWNMDFEDEQRPPRSYVGGPATVSVVEEGPVRVAVQVARDAENSHFVQTIRLATGDAGNRLEFSNVIDWHAKEGTLKAVFPLAATNSNATYNWDIGTIQRPNENERQFEVASHQWIDLADQGGQFGSTILTDVKNGSDKLNDNTVRLTLIRTPGTRGGYTDQGTQDMGHHEIVFGLAGHAGDRRAAQTDWQGYRLNVPLMAFTTAPHAGALGKSFSLASVSSNRVRILGLKKAELSDEIIVRLVELDGKAQPNVTVKFAAPVTAVREVNGQEQPLSSTDAKAANGALQASFTAYQPRTFALKLGAAPTKVSAPQSQPVVLTYDIAVATRDGHPGDGCFDCSLNAQGASQGRSIPADVLPATLDFAGVRFNLAPAGKPNAVVAHGQAINLPAGNFNRVYVLAASANGDQRATFRAGDHPVELNIQNWTGYVGQWDNRVWRPREETQSIPGTGGAARIRVNPYGEVASITPGFIKPADIGWYVSHRHAPDASNEAYAYSYLFVYPIDLPTGAKTLTLPENRAVRIMAITVANDGPAVRAAHPLYDTLERPATAAATSGN